LRQTPIFICLNFTSIFKEFPFFHETSPLAKGYFYAVLRNRFSQTFAPTRLVEKEGEKHVFERVSRG
jgi:hypothetical protein